MLNCTGGTIDDKPMPIIGLYIAGATIIDLMKAFNSKQFWIPSNYFSIGALSLTAISVSMNLSLGLNSPMPSQVDQLAKLAASAFPCTVLVNILPSLGKLGKGHLLPNTTLLAFVIILLILNLCMQIKFGLIHAFKAAHILMIVVMSVLLLTCVFIAATLPLIKSLLKLRFKKLHRQALLEFHNDSDKNIEKNMEKYLMKFSMMAQSSCPHFVLNRSLLYMGVMACGLLSASAFFIALFASITHKDKMVGLKTCIGESDYVRSVLVMLLIQAIAVVMNLVAPSIRMVYIIKAIKSGRSSPSRKEDPLELKRLSMQHLSDINVFRRLFRFLFYPLPVIESDERIGSRHSLQISINLKPYFVHSRGERGSIDFMVESSSRVTHKYISDGKKEEPICLIDFLKSYLSYDFGGVLSFESDEVLPLGSFDEHTGNCWTLPVLTLTCIATALPNIDPASKERLRKTVVNEGLVYVKVVEDHLNDQHYLVKNQDTAYLVSSHLHQRNCRWFGIDLEDLARTHTSPKEVLLALEESTRYSVPEILRLQNEAQREYDVKVVAAQSMYKISRTILRGCWNTDSRCPSSHEIFRKLCINIADILGACFTNLRRCIILEGAKSEIVNKRETAFDMLKLFGKTKTITKMLEDRKIPNLSEEQMAFIDEWRSYLAREQQC